MSHVPESSAHCIKIDQRSMVVLLNYPNEAYLFGIVNVKAIRGTVRILGYNLTPKSGFVTVYSIKEFNTLPVIPVNDGLTENDSSYLSSLKISQKELDRLEAKSLYFSHVFVVSKIKQHESLVSYLTNFGLPMFKRTTDDDCMVRFSCEHEDNVFFEGCEWDELAYKVLGEPRKIIICGGKNVGKSTFLRFLVNRCLAKWAKVLVLDFDPGQSEFTVMGCLSAVIVGQPLLGPNFSHILVPERSIYLGDISVTCSRLYADSIEKLVSFCNSSDYKGIPWIVNTMGFPRGLGITLLSRIMEAIKPTDIIQINSEKEQNNFPSSLTPEFLNLQNLEQSAKDRWKPHLHLLSTVAERNDRGHGLSLRDPGMKRSIVTMSYFKKALTGDNTDLMSIIPKKIKTHDVQIVITKPTSKDIEMTMTDPQKLCCINANLVALCSDKNISHLDCLGFGIVRGFDLNGNFIYIVTPLSEEALRRITVIKMDSSIQLPLTFYKRHVDNINGFYPYINYKIADKLNQPIRRTSSRLRFTHDT